MCPIMGAQVKKPRPPFSYERIKGPTSIISVREAMIDLAVDLEMKRISPSYAARMLRNLADGTKRKPPISVAPRRIRPLDAETRAKVRESHRINPDMSQLELARVYNTNPGRISEALNEVT